MKKSIFILTTVLLLCGILVSAQEEHNCFSVLVGKKATIDGSVLFAHNEDDFGKQLVNWFAVPKKPYHEGTEVVLKNGGKVGQVAFTNRYIWLEIPGMDFSDSYLNEYGVCIASNSCPSREDKPEISDGGIGYNLRQFMAERAVNAKDAVVLAGRLIEKFGYTGSGRTYCIADPNEAWALAVVNGKHWVAQRIPDDEVMVLPNNYTIREVNLNDTENFLSCNNLIDYAIKRGWYKPDTDGPFNFRNTYAGPNSIKHPGNVSRAWGAYHLFNTGFNMSDDFPFSFKPAEKVSKQDLMKLLRYHYEGTVLDKSEGYTKGSPFKLNESMICDRASVYGFVSELRNWMPADIGCLMWLAPQWPDIQPFIPIYAGTTQFPAAFCRQGYLNSLADHYTPPADIHERNDQHAFWAFVEFSELMNNNYGENIGAVRKRNFKIERKLLAIQPGLEKKLIKIQQESAEKCREVVTRLYDNFAMTALSATKKSIKKLRK
ncbi:MAG: C69 family dipeptidase [Bacteroidia bacterium]|nr:C69 family dipeptidase [Bacteroidia bacterium]